MEVSEVRYPPCSDTSETERGRLNETYETMFGHYGGRALQLRLAVLVA